RILFTQFQFDLGATPLGPLPPRLYANRPLFSSAYIIHARPSWRVLFRQKRPCPLALALASAGNNRAARIAMMVMTTKSSIKVKPPLPGPPARLADFLVLLRRFMVRARASPKPSGL